MGKQPFRRNLITPPKPESQKTKAQDNIKEIFDSPENFFDSIISGEFNRAGSRAGQVTYDPNTGFGESQYDEDLRPETTINFDDPENFFRDLESYRASKQPVIDKLGNAAFRLTNIIPQTVGGLAAVLDFEDYFNSNDEIGNGVTRLMNEWKEATNQEFPIYQSERGQALNVTDSGWWIENGSNVANSIVSFGLTGGVIGKSIQGLSKLSKIKKVSNALLGTPTTTIAGEAAETLGIALGLNQAEGILEATEVYERTLQSQRDKLKDQYEGDELDQIARQKAADAASTTINTNRINILLNLASANLFVKSPTLTRSILKKPISFRNIKRTTLEGAQQSTEEVLTYIASQRGIAKGEDKEYDLQDIVRDIGSEEALANAFWGFLGGMGQTIITTEGIHRLQKTIDSETGERMSVRQYNEMVYNRQKEILKSYSEEKFRDIINGFSDQIKLQDQLEDALNNENDEKAKNIQDLLLSNQAYIAFKNGTTEIFEQYFKDIGKKDSQKPGDQNYSEISRKALERIKELENIYINLSPRDNSKELYINRATLLSYNDQFDEIKLRRDENNTELNKQIDRINATRDTENQIDITGIDLSDEKSFPKELKQNPIFKDILKDTKKMRKILGDTEALNKEYIKLSSKGREKSYMTEQEFQDEVQREKRIENDRKIEEEAKLVDKFYENIRDKGYSINKNDNNDIISFGTDQKGVFFKDKNDNVFRVEAGVTNDIPFQTATNIVTGDSVPFDSKLIKKYNLTNIDNILDENQFKKWERLFNIKKRNTERLDALNRLISDHNRTKDRFITETTDLIKELIEYNNEIKFWQNSSDFNMADVKREIDRLAAKRDKVNSRIDTLNAKRQSLGNTLLVLNDYRITLEGLVSNPDNFEEFSFGQELKNLSEKLLKGDFDLDQIEISDSVDTINNWINELEDTRNTLQDTIDDLYELYDESLNNNNDILGGQGDFNEEWNSMDNDQREILHQINILKEDVNMIQDQMGRLNNELERLEDNKDLLTKYEKLKINLSTLEKRNNIKKNSEIDMLISPNQKKDSSNNPVEQVDDNDSRDYKAEKTTPYSTITNVFKYNRKEGTLIYKDGIPVYSDNWQQAANWSRTMGKIKLDNISNYNLRFVNNKQLQELNQSPPVEDIDALYAVLYKNQVPYYSNEGLVYTGIAKESTYTYTKFTEEGLEGYKEWRENILNRLKNENLYTTIKDISRGYARRDDLKKAPKTVFNIKKLQIPLKETILKTNGGLQKVVKGMVYADIGNGQYERLLNYSIKSLPYAEKVEKINTIIKFMTLAEEIKDNNFRTEFNFKNTKSSLPLVGQGNKTGILDYFINWGNSKANPQWNIAIYEKDNDKKIRFTHNGITEILPLNILKDDKGNIRQYGDPEIIRLTDFLETKYLNVVRNEINKVPKEDKSKWIPTDWIPTQEGPQILYKKYKSYNDYVLENNLYTEVVKSDEELELPSFVNQYIKFDKVPKSVLTTKVTDIKIKPKKIPDNDLTNKLENVVTKPVKEDLPTKVTEENAAEIFAGLLMDNSLKSKAKKEPVKEEKQCDKKGGLKKKIKNKNNKGDYFDDYLL